jgi:hypothetical protein
MKPLFLLALLALPAFAASPNGYNYCKVVTTQHTMVSGTNDLTNYPLTVILTNSDLMTTGNGGLVNNTNGYDIGFYPDCSGSGTALKWEMESYSPTTGALVAHVLRPTLSHTANDSIGMFYGGAFTSFQSTASAVWDASYKGVWHLQSGNDSTSANIPTTNHGSTPTPGKIGGGAALSATGYISMGNTLDFSTGDFTLEIWANPLANMYTTLMGKRLNGGAYSMYILATGHNDSGGNAIASSKLSVVLCASGGSVWHGLNTINDVTDGNWHHIAVTRAGPAVHIFVDGVDMLTADAFNSGGTIDVTNSADFNLGFDNGSTHALASMDEARVSDVVRSADWILTEYRNQSDPRTYTSAGPRITQGGSVRVRHIVIGGIYSPGSVRDENCGTNPFFPGRLGATCCRFSNLRRTAWGG